MKQNRTATTAIKAELVDVYRQAMRAGVPLDTVEEKISRVWDRQQVAANRDSEGLVQRERRLSSALPRVVRWGSLAVPLVLLLLGVGLLGTAVTPIVSYYVWEWPKLQATNLTTPIPPEFVLDAAPVVIAQAQAATNAAAVGEEVEREPTIINTELDYTNLSTWFTQANLPELAGASLQQTDETYTLEIPSLNLAEATVVVGGTNLNKSLIHYPGTALPGEFGSPVIFGHSVLRQFYNPSLKNPRRYNSIFSTIMTLKKGDKIYLTHKNTRYTYVVQDKTEVKPQDTYILAQKFDSRQLKLVTCTPEGTYLRRGVVTATLVQE